MKHKFYDEILQIASKLCLYIKKEKDDFIIEIYQNNKKLYYHKFDENHDTNLDCIYVARVEKILNDKKTAFVDIGESKNSLLNLSEKDSFNALNNNEIKQGQSIIVQVKRIKSGHKQSVLTRDIKISGKFLLLMPYNNYVGFSSKIKDGDIKKHLKDIYNKTLSFNKYGVIFRTAAEKASTSMILEDYENLQKIFESFCNNWNYQKPPYLLFKPKNDILDYLFKILNSLKFEKIYSNSNEIIEQIKTWGYDASYEANIYHSLNKFNENIGLSDGSNIVISRCEALTAIDINSSSSYFMKEKDSFLKINAYASLEIIRNIVLFDIKGIILIDYINMPKKEDYSILESLVTKLFAFDLNSTIIHGFTKTGLLEITRKK